MAQQSAQDLIRSYLQDAIAAEKSFELQFKEFAAQPGDAVARELFLRRADDVRQQYGSLEARLVALGGTSSTVKTVLAQLFAVTPKVSQLGRSPQERVLQNIMSAYAIGHTKVAMYEALAIMAQTAGDSGTEQLARSIRQQERDEADKLWLHLRVAARQTFVDLAAPATYPVAS